MEMEGRALGKMLHESVTTTSGVALSRRFGSRLHALSINPRHRG